MNCDRSGPTRRGVAVGVPSSSPSTACSASGVVVASGVTGTAEEAVRAATPEDLPAVVALAESLRAELTPMRGGRIWAVREARRGPLDEAYGALLLDPAAWVVVGTLDDVVVGFGIATVEPLADGGTLGVVTELFVDSEARAVGVGETMLESL